jgi:hypothetical protein
MRLLSLRLSSASGGFQHERMFALMSELAYIRARLADTRTPLLGLTPKKMA